MDEAVNQEWNVPPEFTKVMADFAKDLITTFPEYTNRLPRGLQDLLDNKTKTPEIKALFVHAKGVFPERFFDLLYHNEEIFEDDTKDTCFIPGIDFRDLWKQDIGDKTRLIMWKYLQLILFAVVHTESSGESFGEAAKLFEAIDEEELKAKLEETMQQMTEILDPSGASGPTTPEGLPDADKLREHIGGLLQGKLGKLAAEITEETLNESSFDLSGAATVGDVFQKLFKSPGKLIELVKRVGSTLDAKLESGELKETELMEEAADLMGKMQTMPGMKNMRNMLAQMGMPGAGGGGKVNMGAMKSQMQRNLRQAKTRDRLRKKLSDRQSKDEQIQALEAELIAMRTANEGALAPSLPPSPKKKKKRRRKRKPKNKK